mmetsp:Transcript_12762/g.38682  ORF Transcript_12762/g.38682 Transcript_12762/m.38682 type:complete len:232 (-) Transcript_12762:189-884(-)
MKKARRKPTGVSAPSSAARDAAHAAALGRPFRALLAARLDLGHRLDLVDQPRRVPPRRQPARCAQLRLAAECSSDGEERDGDRVRAPALRSEESLLILAPRAVGASRRALLRQRAARAALRGARRLCRSAEASQVPYCVGAVALAGERAAQPDVERHLRRRVPLQLVAPARVCAVVRAKVDLEAGGEAAALANLEAVLLPVLRAARPAAQRRRSQLGGSGRERADGRAADR